MAELDALVKKISLSVPFSIQETATLAYEVLSVDKDFKGSKVKRDISADGSNLCVNFYSPDLKMLRVAVNTYLKSLILVVKTINQFPS